jgi:hypothetical protein
VLKQLSGVPLGVQALEAIGTVTADDYQRAFAPLVDRARRTGTRMRLLYQFGPDFHRSAGLSRHWGASARFS